MQRFGIEDFLKANNIRPHPVELLGRPGNFAGVVFFAVMLAPIKYLVGQRQITEVEIADAKGLAAIAVHRGRMRDLPS
ncbi:MAG: hypothetical protein HC774_04385, partial [Sphingomonadales bacterium]|nr:hypothetical protein [Sphingomonadales bacterium]